MTSYNRASLSGGFGRTVPIERAFGTAYLFSRPLPIDSYRLHLSSPITTPSTRSVGESTPKRHVPRHVIAPSLIENTTDTFAIGMKGPSLIYTQTSSYSPGAGATMNFWSSEAISTRNRLSVCRLSNSNDRKAGAWMRRVSPVMTVVIRPTARDFSFKLGSARTGKLGTHPPIRLGKIRAALSQS